MSLRGLKRMKIIQEYLNGKEDPDYEVFPTKKEGKYIVKKRDKNLQSEADTPEQPVPEETGEEEPAHEEAAPEPVEDVPKAPLKKPAPKKVAPPKETKNEFDPTINLEILNQLRTLGEELKQERQAKQQKKLIKQTVQNQMYKQQYRNQYIEQEPVYEEEVYEEAPEQVMIPMAKPTYIRRRLNLIKR